MGPLSIYYGLHVPHPNLYVEALTPQMWLFGDRAFMEVIKVKWGQKGGALSQ